MQAKEYVFRLRKIDILVKNKMIEIEKWKQIANVKAVNTTNEKIKTSGRQQEIADAVIQYVDIQNDIDKLLTEKKEIISTIEQLSAKEYTVLHKAYVQNMTFKEITAEMNRGYSWIMKEHKKALASLQKILDKRNNCESR